MKVLIYYRENDLKPIGGPSGYLCGLKKGMEMIEQEKVSIQFLPSLHTKNKIKVGVTESKNKYIKNFLSYYRKMRWVNTIIKILYKNEEPIISFDEFDIIHFHKTLDIYLLRKTLEDFKGTVLLTSHSPEPLSNEIINLLPKSFRKIFKNRLKNLIKMDEFAFKRADFIVFPCETADEPYIHAWKYYNEIKEMKKDKYRYLLTGTNPREIIQSREEIRQKYEIPKNAFVVSFVGRHNEIKGYDRLRNIGKIFLESHENTYVVVAGREEPLVGINHPRWIEVGWTNAPHDIINASDLFVLPNKETYFDLVMLEVLSIAKMSLISYTGGNKHFEKYNDRGIVFFETEEELLMKLNEIYMMNNIQRIEMGNHNRNIFIDNFTNEIFATNYLKLLEKLDG